MPLRPGVITVPMQLNPLNLNQGIAMVPRQLIFGNGFVNRVDGTSIQAEAPQGLIRPCLPDLLHAGFVARGGVADSTPIPDTDGK